MSLPASSIAPAAPGPLDHTTPPLGLVTVLGCVVPNMELPQFDGSDLIAWIAQVEQFSLLITRHLSIAYNLL
ncbi:hypothetical protein ACS0TY_026796 [Phlomoides rotata]